MFSRPGRPCNGWRGWGSVRSRRHASRLSLSLEVLEPRLLMASYLVHSRDHFRGPEIPQPTELPSPALRPPAVVAPGPVRVSLTVGQEISSQDADAGPPSPAPYLVVPETPAFHGTGSTAQPIPNVPYAGVAGRLSPGDTIDLYQVELGSGTLALRLAAAYDEAPAAPPLRLWVFNAQGQVVAVATASNGVVDLSVSPGQSGLEAGSAVFIGVDSASPVVASSGVGYQLWFLRLPGTDGSPNAFGGEAAALQGEIGGAVALMPSGSIPGTSGNGTSIAGGGPIDSAPPASAQSPTLAAAPSVGFLTNGAPSLTVAMATRTVNDSEMPAASWRGDEPLPSGFEGRVSEGEETAASSLLVAVRGPGGFPVLAAAAVGDWQHGLDEPKEPAVDDRHPELTSSPEPEACPAAAFPVILAAAASSTRLDEPADRTANSRGAGYATLATAYALSIDHAQFVDLIGRLPTLGRCWPWPRGWMTKKRRRKERPRV